MMLKQRDIIGYAMALEHASFQLFKRPNYIIIAISPNFKMRDNTRREIESNIRAINANDMVKCNESCISLSNGSMVLFYSNTQKNIFRGVAPDMILAMDEELSEKHKRDVLPCIYSRDSFLYTVLREDRL